MPSLTLTIDLEDPSALYAPEGRYVTMAERVLALCAETRRRATFFTVGRVAEAAPDLVRRIVAEGHEVAYHSHAHISLTEEDPARFRRETREDKDRIEQLTGQPLLGFRAPRFSLTPRTLWAVDILGELGFRYSSSLMPTNISLFGFKAAPRHPFRWPNGMIELPLPVASVGPLRVPYLGGIYLYLMPYPLVRVLARRAVAKECLWTHAHPYDLDRSSPFAPMPDTPNWVAFVLWMARWRAENQIRRVLSLAEAGTLGERVRALDGSLPTFPKPQDG